uniref:Putative secreted protein n=1 Tax=Anopheles darlingi TaxID=43151 RepID=A0A2M4DMD4_ANODA
MLEKKKKINFRSRWTDVLLLLLGLLVVFVGCGKHGTVICVAYNAPAHPPARRTASPTIPSCCGAPGSGKREPRVPAGPAGECVRVCACVCVLN